MAIHLLSAKRTGDDLAAGRVTAADQSLYLTASFLIWIIPAYLFLFPAPRTTEPEFFWTVWLVELAIVVLFCITGIGYCLRKCRVDPARNFLLVVWGIYYLVEAALFAAGVESTRPVDVVRLIASASAVLLVFIRIGAHMNRVASLRETTNTGRAR